MPNASRVLLALALAAGWLTPQTQAQAQVRAPAASAASAQPQNGRPPMPLARDSATTSRPRAAPPVVMPLPEPAKEDSTIAVLVSPAEEATLSSQMPGKIKRINVGLGATFRKGAVLLELDCSEQEAQVQTVQAELLGARETHLAKLRLQALGAAGELEVTVAAAAAERAKSQINLREAQLAYCKVIAPFDGMVAKLKVKGAESVSLGQPLLDIVNPALLKAQFYVPASWFSWIKTGMAFKVRMGDDDKTYSARVSKLNARVEGVNQSLEIEGRFDGKTLGLLPGMVGTAVFPAGAGRP